MRTWLITITGAALFTVVTPVLAQDPVVVGEAATGVRTSNVAQGLDAWRAQPLPAIPAVLAGECRVLGARGGPRRHVSIAIPSLQDTRISHTLMFGEQDMLIRYLRHHYALGNRGFVGPAESTLQVDYQQGFALKMKHTEGEARGAKVTLPEFESVDEFGLATAAMHAVLHLCDP